MKINTIIIEDEPMARRAIERFCERQNKLNLVGSYENPTQVLDQLADLEVDLILLDIEMPEMTGLEFLEKLSFHPWLIFTTSNPDYAYDAFEYQVIDFLKKPITYPRFDQAIQKLISSIKVEHSSESATEDPQDFYIRDGNRLIRLEWTEILYFENAGDYVKIVMEGRTHIIYSTMKEIETKLSEKLFFRVHRSYIVNLAKIKDIEDSTLVIAKKVIPISRAKRPLLLQKINLL